MRRASGQPCAARCSRVCEDLPESAPVFLARFSPETEAEERRTMEEALGARRAAVAPMAAAG